MSPTDRDIDPLAPTVSPTADKPDATLTETERPVPARETAARPGGRVGRYEIEERLGTGGMGVVYRARDPELARPVAIKLLHPHLGAHQQRLLAEGRAVASLRHPNVVTIHDVGVHGGELFIAMELVDGMTLRSWLAESRDWREIVAMFAQAGAGLAAAHAAGIVHRDFKPDNVLVAGDRAVVTDFGLARSIGAAVADEGISGTPTYMSPEQFRNETVDARSDQFSFCVALFAALYGRRPFVVDDKSVDQIKTAVLAGKIIEPSDRRGVPARIDAALRRGLAVDPAARHPSMDVLLAELAPRRRRAALIGTSLLGIAGATIAITLARSSGPPESVAPHFSPASARQLTFSDAPTSPELSPDGTRLAFVAGPSTDEVFVRDLATGETRQVYRGDGVWAVRWSPDARSLIAASYRSISIVSLTTGDVREVPGCVATDWSPDGATIATYCGGELHLTDARTLARRKVAVATPVPEVYSYLAWSRTDRLLISSVAQTRMDVWTVRPDGSEVQLVRSVSAGPPARWNARGDGIYLATDIGPIVRIAELPFPGLPDATGRVVFEYTKRGVATGDGFAVASDEQRLIYVQAEAEANVVKVSRDGALTELTTDRQRKGGIEISPDGSQLLFTAGPSPDALGLFMMPIDGGAPKRLTAPEINVYVASWSPDGNQVIYTRRDGERFELWRLDLMTTKSTRLVDGNVGGWVAWAPDGRILYRRADRTMSMLDPRSDTDRAILEGRIVHYPRLTPDGSAIAYIEPGSRDEVRLYTIATGTDIRLHDLALPLGWSGDGKWLYAIANTRPTVFAIDREGRHDTRLIAAGKTVGIIGPGDVAPDESAAVLLLTKVRSELWMVSIGEAATPVPAPESVRTFPRDPDPRAPTNLGLDGTIDAPPTGWQVTGGATIVDDDGRRAARIELGSTIRQPIDATPYRGKRLRVRAQVRGARGTFDLRVGYLDGEVAFKRSPINTSAWSSVEVDLDVEPDATRIALYVAASGGPVWVDDITLELAR